jgi:hypothetical protein
MYRIWVSGTLLVIAALVAALGASHASARFPGTIAPEIPGIGDASGLDGPGPQVEVFGGRSGLTRGGKVWVEVRCTTSTKTGCAGTVELLRGGTASVARAPFVLAETQSEGVYARLSRTARRRAARATGLTLLAKACAADSMRRVACDSAELSLHARR